MLVVVELLVLLPLIVKGVLVAVYAVVIHGAFNCSFNYGNVDSVGY